MTNQESIRIEDTSRLISEGIVEGATTRTCPSPQGLESAFFLPAGKTVTVAPGRAFIVKSGEADWGRIQFYRPGRMTGPLVYSEIEAESPKNAYLNSIAWKSMISMSASGSLLGFALMAISPVMLVTGRIPVTNYIDLAIILTSIGAGLLMIGTSAAHMHLHLSAIWRGGDHAVKALYDTQGIPTLRIPMAKSRCDIETS